MTHLNDLSKVYLESVAESAVPGKPAERLGAVTGISKADQESAADRIRKKTAEKKAALEKKRGMKLDDHPEYNYKVDEALDPVGQEDSDVDNDGKKNTKSDKYLIKRRKAIGKALATRKEEVEQIDEIHTQAHKPHEVPNKDLKKLVAKATKRIDYDVDGDVDKNDPKAGPMGEFVPSADGKKRLYSGVRKESFSNWRQDLSEVMGEGETEKKIKEKKVNNKVKINPNLGEAIEEIGGTLLEMIEVDEFDVAVESVYEELIEEGFTEDEVEYGIETALNTLEEGYYDSAVAASKAKSPETPAPKKSMKDRLKSAAKKAIISTASAAGKAMKAKATVQAAPGKASAKARSIAKRVKAIAKKGYESGRGPVEKKTTYRGAGVGRKEKIGEQASMSPQEIALQKRKANIDAMIARKRKQELSKQTEQPATAMGEAVVNENVATGKARRAKFGGIAQKVGNSEVVTNKEKAATLEKHFAAKKAKEKAAGEAAHKAASAKGLSPAEAEMRRKAAERKAARMRKEEVEQLDEMPYQVYGSPDGKKEKKVGKPVKSKKYADARAAELADTHKATGGKYRSEYTEAAEDRLRDQRMERGGVDGNVDYSRPPAKKLSNKELGIRDFTPAEKAKRAKEMVAHLKKMRG